MAEMIHATSSEQHPCLLLKRGTHGQVALMTGTAASGAFRLWHGLQFKNWWKLCNEQMERDGVLEMVLQKLLGWTAAT